MKTTQFFTKLHFRFRSQEFTDYHISDPTNITFCLKELRAILNFADALSLDMTINFESAGKYVSRKMQRFGSTITQNVKYFSRPVVFAFGSPDAFTANFVMSTLPPDDSSQADRSVRRSVTKEKPKSRRDNKSLQNQSESRNLTLNLSEVIDLDVNGDVNIPPTVWTFNSSLIGINSFKFCFTSNAGDGITSSNTIRNCNWRNPNPNKLSSNYSGYFHDR